jgi:hypothetical protein
MAESNILKTRPRPVCLRSGCSPAKALEVCCFEGSVYGGVPPTGPPHTTGSASIGGMGLE